MHTDVDVADTLQRVHVAQANVSAFEVLVFHTGERAETSRVIRSDDLCAVAYLHYLKPQRSSKDALRLEVKAREVFCILQILTVVTCAPLCSQPDCHCYKRR